jgi:hypothetical protein
MISYYRSANYRSTEPSQCAKVSNCKVCKSDVSGVITCRDLDRAVHHILQRF